MSYLIEIWQQLHFIRPLWLLSILPLLCIWLALWLQSLKHNEWQSFIAKDKLKALQIQSSAKAGSAHGYLLLGWILASLALAGPSWQKIEMPVSKDSSALVILLDLSPSMLSSDISPNRYTRVRFKLLDILKQRKDGQTALIAYSGGAHIVAPLTNDTNTIANLLPALNPTMMPETGSNTESAVELAMRMIKDAGVFSANLLLITDGVDSKALRWITDKLPSQHQLSVLGVGSSDPVPIPDPRGGFLLNSMNSMVLTRLNRNELQTLSQVSGGRYVDLKSDDTDTNLLLAFFEQEIRQSDPLDTSPNLSVDDWQDMGYLLILLILPLLAFGFRKGVIF